MDHAHMRKFTLIIIFLFSLSSQALAAITLSQSLGAQDDGTNKQTSAGVTLSSVTAGNLIVTVLSVDKNSGAITVPTGFTLINDNVATSVSVAAAYKVATGGETTITWSWTASQFFSVWAGEYAGGVKTLDVAAENSTESVVTSLSSGTTATTTKANGLGFAYMASDTGNNTDGTRGWTNSFTENGWQGSGGAGTPGLSTAHLLDLGTVGTKETTFSCTDTGDQMAVGVAAFNLSGIKTVNDLAKASVKTINGLAIGSVKSRDGLS